MDTLQAIIELVKTQGAPTVLLAVGLFFTIKNVWPWITSEFTRWRAENREDRLREEDRDQKWKEGHDLSLRNIEKVVINNSEVTQKSTEYIARLTEVLDSRARSEQEIADRVGRVEVKVDGIDRKVDEISEKIK